MESSQQESDERWEMAVAGRLSKLRTMPVETSRLAAMLRAKIPEPARASRSPWLSIRSFRAVAAGILLLGAIGAVLLVATATRPALASPAEMAKMHQELVSGTTPAMQVESIEAANKVLAGEHPHFPALPGVPVNHGMACCMTSVKDKKVACVLMKREGVPVSLMVARSKDMRTPSSPVTLHDGVRYHVQSSGKLNMVMAERNDRWVCLIGEMPAERLIDIAIQLRF